MRRKSSAATSVSLCAVCEDASRYVCPRCSAPYCSVDCYRRHSQGCSREFAEEHFREELSSVAADLDTQNMMKDILVKLHKAGLDDDLEGPVGLNGLDGLCESDEDDWGNEEEIVPGVSSARLGALARGELDFDDLNETEVQAITKKMMSDIPVDPWTPWWESRDMREVRLSATGTRLVVEVVENVAKTSNVENQGDQDDKDDCVSSVPAGPREPIPPLSSLISKEPSDAILFFIVDVLYWYCLVQRMYNGDLSLGGEELVHMLIKNFKAIGTDSGNGAMTPGCDDLRAFAEGLMDRCEAMGLFSGLDAQGVSAGVLKDVAMVLGLHRTGVLLGLSDVLDVARAVKAHKEVGVGRRREAMLVERKLVFFLSWANERIDQIASLAGRNLSDVYDAAMERIRCLQVDGGSDNSDESLRIV